MTSPHDASTLRPAVDADADAIAAVEDACFGTDAWSHATVSAELVRDDRVLLVDTSVPDLAGYVDVGVVGDVADLHRVAVRPGQRRRGLASALVEAGLAQASARGADRVLLEVAVDNHAALALYAGSGFVEISRRRGYYGSGRDAAVLERVLP